MITFFSLGLYCFVVWFISIFTTEAKLDKKFLGKFKTKKLLKRLNPGIINVDDLED